MSVGHGYDIFGRPDCLAGSGGMVRFAIYLCPILLHFPPSTTHCYLVLGMHQLADYARSSTCFYDHCRMLLLHKC